MKKNSTLQIILASTAILAVGLGALYVYLFLSLSHMGEDQLGKAGEIKDANRILKEEKLNEKKIGVYFLREGEQAGFVSSLESRCVGLSLSCTTTSLTENEESGGVIKLLSVSMSANGTLSNINRLLSYFETANYPIEVRKTNITSKEEGWSAAFEITVPVLIQN